MPMFVAPIARILGDRIGTRPLMFAGLVLQAVGLGWIALITAPDNTFVELIPAFVMAGTGMALVFPTAAATVLASVRPEEQGKASGATNAIREIGGVMGVSVLASIFAANGGYESPQAFTDGVVSALPIAVVVLAVGAVLALLVPGRGRLAAAPTEQLSAADRPAASRARRAPGPAAPSAG
jgi:MFS family permease